jgi:hypothetical protein
MYVFCIPKNKKLIVMTKNPLKYQNYSPSFTKILGTSIGSRYISSNILWIAYFGHNLYEKYQYNKKISKEVEVKLYDEAQARTVKIEPKYFDPQTWFYTTCLIGNLCAFGLEKILIENSLHKQTLMKVGLHSGIASIVFRLLHFFDSREKEFICTDVNTGEEIPHENMIRSDWFNEFNDNSFITILSS